VSKVCQTISKLVIYLGTMGLDLEAELKKLNLRLKAGGTRVTVEARGNSLLLRGTFPPKPRSGKVKPYQQRLFLGYRFSLAGLRATEQEAKRVSADLELNNFNWLDWLDESENDGPTSNIPISYWLEKFEEHHWNLTAKSRKSLISWRNYERAFKKFQDTSKFLTLDEILIAIASTPPDTAARLNACMYLSKLAQFAGIDGVEKITELKGGYSTKCVNPRSLPSDEKIALTVESIGQPGWRWLVGMLAAYGLRPHEIFDIDMSEFPAVRIAKDTKTGERLVYPLYPQWGTSWKLDKVIFPKLSRRTADNLIPQWFRNRNIGFRPYDLRHCYARRCFEFDIPTNRAAKLMGHSEDIHVRAYRAWIDERYYRQKFEQDIFGDGKPKAPDISVITSSPQE
jgi:integrase